VAVGPVLGPTARIRLVGHRIAMWPSPGLAREEDVQRRRFDRVRGSAETRGPEASAALKIIRHAPAPQETGFDAAPPAEDPSRPSRLWMGLEAAG